MTKLVLILTALFSINSYACQCEEGSEAIWPTSAAKQIVKEAVGYEPLDSEVSLEKYLPSIGERFSRLIGRLGEREMTSCDFDAGDGTITHMCVSKRTAIVQVDLSTCSVKLKVKTKTQSAKAAVLESTCDELKVVQKCTLVGNVVPQEKCKPVYSESI